MALNALFTGASGLQANSASLDVIGNNLANSNTNGFKSQRALFSDLLYQTINAGSGATATTGGSNPTQLGFGVNVGAISSSFNQGNVNGTGRNLDFGIQGTGFFVLSDGVNESYTRNGSFDVDSNGFLVDPSTGNRVQRVGTSGEGSATLPAFQVAGNQDIRIPIGAGVQGTPTTSVNYRGNLNAGMAVGETYTTSIQVYDTQSTPRSFSVTFTKTAANTFDVTGTVTGGTVAIAPTTITFDNAGLLQAPASLTATFTGLPGPQTATLNLGTVGQSSGLTQFGNVSSAAATTQDGRSSGTLTSVNVRSDGTLEGIFSNGRILPVAQLAIADFNNVGGLLRSGNNSFVASASSGEAIIGEAETSGRGSIQGGALEASNVDIAVEFSRLIIAQRGFQVNARTITAANETLQELANIIR